MGCLIPKSKFRIDICIECKVKHGDSSKKRVFKCDLCDRWFCKKHLEPRLAFIKDLNAIAKYPEIRVLLDAEWKREDGHPDFVYSRKKFEEIEMEERRRTQLIKEALDRMNHYYDMITPKPIDLEADRQKRVEMLLKEEVELDKKQEPESKVREKKTTQGIVSEGQFHFIRGETQQTEEKRTIQIETPRLEKKKTSHVNATGLIVSLVVCLIGLLLFLYSSRDVYLIFIIPFIPFPIPFWVIGIGLMIFGGLGLIASLT